MQWDADSRLTGGILQRGKWCIAYERLIALSPILHPNIELADPGRRPAAREREEATSFIGLLGDRCQRLVTLEFERHKVRNASPSRHMLLDRGTTLHRLAAVLAMPTLPISNLPYPGPFRVGSHRAQPAIPVR